MVASATCQLIPSAGISAAPPALSTPVADIDTVDPGVTYSFSAVREALANTPSDTAVETIIKPLEIERSEPSDGLFTMPKSLEPSALAAYVQDPPPSR